MIANITTMAVSGLVFSSWGFAVNICSLLRLSKPGRCLFVPHSFNIHHTKLTIIIDCMTVLVYGFPVDGCLTANGIPLGSTSILQHLIITARSSISGSIEECSAGSVSIANLKMTIQTVSTVHVGNLALITRHKVLECRLIVLDRILSRLKLRSMSLLLHSIPLDSIGCFHNGMGCIGFLVVCAVVPEGVSTVGRAGFDHAVANRPEHGTFLGTWECRCHQRCFCVSSMGIPAGEAEGIIALYGMPGMLVSSMEGISIRSSTVICAIEGAGHTSSKLRCFMPCIMRSGILVLPGLTPVSG